MTSCLLKILICCFVVYQQAHADPSKDEVVITALVEFCATEHNVTLEQIGVNDTIKSVDELHKLYKNILNKQDELDELPAGVGNCVIGCIYNKLGYTLQNGQLVLTPFRPMDEKKMGGVLLLQRILNVLCKNYTTSMCDLAGCLVRNT